MLLDKNQFMLRDDITFLNNGSFGALPKDIFNQQIEYLKLMEESPVDFYLNIAPQLIDNSFTKLSKFLNCNVDNLFFIDNATTAVNTCLNSLLQYYSGFVEIVYFNSIYPAVRNQLKYYQKFNNIKLIEIELNYPTTKQDILDSFELEITKCSRIAIIDYISSSTSIVFPIEELVEICSSKGIVSIIDGAHAIGQVDLDFSKIEYDFFLSNCHKWLFTPRGSCFLWINDLYKDLIHPLTISLYYEKELKNEFFWTGTKDLSTYISVSDAIDFVEKIGRDKIMNHNNSLNYEAKKVLMEINKGLVVDDNLNLAMSTHFLTDKYDWICREPNSIRQEFYNRYKIEVPFFVFDNKLWFRISAQIFNCIEDYELLKEKLIDFIK